MASSQYSLSRAARPDRVAALFSHACPCCASTRWSAHSFGSGAPNRTGHVHVQGRPSSPPAWYRTVTKSRFALVRQTAVGLLHDHVFLPPALGQAFHSGESMQAPVVPCQLKEVIRWVRVLTHDDLNCGVSPARCSRSLGRRTTTGRSHQLAPLTGRGCCGVGNIGESGDRGGSGRSGNAAGTWCSLRPDRGAGAHPPAVRSEFAPHVGCRRPTRTDARRPWRAAAAGRCAPPDDAGTRRRPSDQGGGAARGERHRGPVLRRRRRGRLPACSPAQPGSWQTAFVPPTWLMANRFRSTTGPQPRGVSLPRTRIGPTGASPR